NETFDSKSSTQLQLTKLFHQAEIIPNAHLVKTTLFMHFVNFSNKKLEAQLVVPLPEDAHVCGLALDSKDENGQPIMLEASLVEKQKARIVFEKDVRDHETGDCLVELVEGNSFKTRVYPLTPNVER